MKQYEVYLIVLDPTAGQEIKKTRPCVIISPDEMNTHIGTVIIAPMTTKNHDYPSRAKIKFMSKNGWIMLDQIRCLDKSRLVKNIGKIGENDIKIIKNILNEMLIE